MFYPPVGTCDIAPCSIHSVALAPNRPIRHQWPMRWTLPNILTAGRVVAAPCVALAFVIFDRPLADWIALILFFLASVTDYLDGWLARRLNKISEVGKMLDPIADKAMVLIALAVLVARQPAKVELAGGKYWIVDASAFAILVPAAVIILREVMVSGLREYLGDVKLPVTKLAKWKTTLQMLAIGMLFLAPLLPQFSGVPNQVENYNELTAGWSAEVIATKAGITMLWLAAILTAVTGWDYFRKGLAYIRRREEG